MKRQKHLEHNNPVGGFAYISENEIRDFYNSIHASENIYELKYKRRKLNKSVSSQEPGVARKRGRPRKYF